MKFDLLTEITIEASPQRVWEILTDLERYETWNPFVVACQGRVATGERLICRLHPPGERAQTVKPTVTVADPSGQFRMARTRRTTSRSPGPTPLRSRADLRRRDPPASPGVLLRPTCALRPPVARLDDKAGFRTHERGAEGPSRVERRGWLLISAGRGRLDAAADTAKWDRRPARSAGTRGRSHDSRSEWQNLLPWPPIRRGWLRCHRT